MNIAKFKIVFGCAFFIFFYGINKGAAQERFEKSAFYNVMDTGDIAAIDNELNVVHSSSLSDKNGYEGTLLMKKADMVARPKKKLDLFKDGRIKLETALVSDEKNTELHFLRLTIEEHAPKIVKYRADIENDKLIIEKNFKNLSPAVQYAIRQYCKKSKVLHEEDLQ